MASKLHTANDVADLLGVELDTLYRYARSGQLAGIKIGKFWRFEDSAVEAFIAARRHGPRRVEPATVLPELLKRAAHTQGGVTSGSVAWSYADLDRASDGLARALVDAGVKPGDRVLVVLPTCVEFLVACFGVWKARAVLVPDYAGIKTPSLQHLLEDSEPIAVVVDGAVAERLEEIPGALAGVRAAFVKDRAFTLSGREDLAVRSLAEAMEVDASRAPVDWSAARAHDVVSINYTSGSTGRPKGVMHTHGSWLASAHFTADHVGLTESDHIVVPLPLHHGLAFRQLLAYLIAGGRITLATDVYQALRVVRDGTPTALVMVPAAVAIALDHFSAVLRHADHHLRYVEIGSAALAADRLTTLHHLLPSTQIHLPYGLTEARVGYLGRGSTGLLNRLDTVATGLEVSVNDAQGRPVPPGQSGEIVLRGQGMMRGYWERSANGDPSTTAVTDVFRTGDAARVNDSGMIELLGRVDDVLKLGGRKVNPGEIELILNAHPEVAESAVVPTDDPSGIFECALHAFVVLAPNADPDKDRLIAHCAEHLEHYKVPSQVHFRSSLPKSPVGKILRPVLVNELAPARAS